MKIDLHVHSDYSLDCHETMETQITAAVKKGIDVLCFCDHLEKTVFCNTFDDFPFSDRENEFFALRDKYADKIKLLLGFEIGEPWLNQDILKEVDKHYCDMIIGSCHYAVDKYYYSSARASFERICYEYNEAVYQMVGYGGFDVVGHIDLPKRYLKEDYVDIPDQINATMQLIAKNNLVAEVNCSPLKHGMSEPCPSYKYLQEYAKAGAKHVTMSSDAHTPKFLGIGYEEVSAKLPQELKLCYFEKRRMKLL